MLHTLLSSPSALLFSCSCFNQQNGGSVQKERCVLQLKERGATKAKGKLGTFDKIKEKRLAGVDFSSLPPLNVERSGACQLSHPSATYLDLICPPLLPSFGCVPVVALGCCTDSSAFFPLKPLQRAGQPAAASSRSPSLVEHQGDLSSFKVMRADLSSRDVTLSTTFTPGFPIPTSTKLAPTPFPPPPPPPFHINCKLLLLVERDVDL